MSVLLPSGYTQVEYIQSSGTEYIDTGFTPNQDTRVDATFMFLTSANGTDIYGASQNYNDRAFEFGSWDSKFAFNYNDYNPTFGTIVLNTKIHSSQNKNVATVEIENGATYTYSFTYASFTAPNTMWLFAFNRGTVKNFGYGGIIYAITIWDDGTKVRDYIPCIRESDDAIGMYDLVNNTFNGNSGTGTFVAGPEIDWKDYYQEVQYIQSSGTQYIDTGVKPNNNTDYLEIDASYVGTDTVGCLFGVVEDANYYWQLNKTTTTNQFRLITNNGDVFYTSADYVNKHLYRTNQNKLYIDDNLVATGQGTHSFSYTLFLFARNYSSSATVNQFGAWKIYTYKMYSSNVLIQELIPCYRKSDDKPGMYDIVAGQFLTNAGTGDFTVGPDVLPPKMYFGGTEINDIYYNGNIVNDVYFNGVLVKEGNYVPAITIYQEDFESYTTDAQVTTAGFNMFYNGTGNSNQKIAEVQRDGVANKVLQAQGASSWESLLIHDLTMPAVITQRYLVMEFDTYCVASSSNAFLTIFSTGTSSANAWNNLFALCFYSNATQVYGVRAGSTNTTDVTNPLSVNTWYHIKFIIDTQTSNLIVYSNGVKEVEGTYATTVNPATVKSFALVGANNGGTSTTYYDNIHIYLTDHI